MRNGNSIRVFLYFFLFSCIFFSCSSEKDSILVDSWEEEDGVQVGFHIAFEEIPDTRAPEGDYDNGMGSDFENYIDFANTNFRILFFDVDNKYLSALQPERIALVGNAGVRSKYYDVVGGINKPLSSDFKVVMLANWRDYPQELKVGETTIGDICSSINSQYPYISPFILSLDNLIPIYGVKYCENKKFYSNMCTYLGTIHMLRAMAKVEVNCVDTCGWTLERVTLHRYNSKGYCAPDNIVDESGYVKGNYDDDYVDKLHLPAGKNDADDKELAFERMSDSRFVIYVPEYQNVVDGKKAIDASEIKIKFKQSEKVHTIDFKYYDAPSSKVEVGTPFDIRRNYYYKFNVTRTHVDVVDVCVKVVPYTEIILEPDFGL